MTQPIHDYHVSTARGDIVFYEFPACAYRIDPNHATEAIAARRVIGFDYCENGDSLEKTEFEPSIACEGYGCVTAIRVPASESNILEANLIKMIAGLASGTPWSDWAMPDLVHGSWRAALADEGDFAWLFIVDGCVTYCNYGFLLDGTSAEIGEGSSMGRDWTFERQESLAGGQAILLSGDENSDGGFSSWIAEDTTSQAAGVGQRLAELGWIGSTDLYQP